MIEGQNQRRWWDFLAALSLGLAFFLAAIRLANTNWTESLGLNLLLVWVALALGILLGYSRFPGWLSGLFAAVYALGIPGMVLLSLLDGEPWSRRLLELFTRIGESIVKLTRNEPNYDPLPFLVTMMFLLWIAAMAAGYGFSRSLKPWAGLIAAGVVIFVVEFSFDLFAVRNSGTIYTFLFVICVIVLVSRVFYLQRRQSWEALGSQVETEVSGDLAKGALLVALFLASLAWASPRIIRTFTPGSTENIHLTAGLQRFRERFENAMNSLRSPSPIVVTSMGGTLALGNNSNTSEETVLVVTPRGRLVDTTRFYWSGREYDTYENDHWTAQEHTLKNLGPLVGAYEYGWQMQTQVRVEFVSQNSALRTLFYPGEIVLVDVPAQGISMKDPYGEEDFSALISDPPLQEGQVYSVTGKLSTPSILAMRASAERSYPGYILETYTQLPKNFSPKVRQLAREIGAGLDTPYDQVDAITRYLRASIDYAPSVPQPPEGADPIEWFLFDHQAGFCNYYATAEVLMLRSRGIPARLVVGYAQGIWNEEERYYQVRGRDYHAWPEVFFPGLGWVPFEPTASQQALTYPLGEEQERTFAPLELIPTPTIYMPDQGGGGEGDMAELLARLAAQERERLIRRIALIAGIVFSLGLVGWGVYGIRKRYFGPDQPALALRLERFATQKGITVPAWLRNWSERSQRTAMESLFAMVPGALKALGAPAQPSQTPAEQIAVLIKVLPEAERAGKALLHEYLISEYSPREGNFAKASDSARQIRKLAWQARLHRKREKPEKRKPEYQRRGG